MKKNKRSSIFLFKMIVVVIMLVPFLVSGCVCSSAKRAPKYTKDGKLVVVFWHSMAGELGKVMTDMIDEFNRTNKDGIFVKSEFIGEYGMLNQKIAAAVFAEIPPHISQVYETWAMQLQEEGAIEELDKYVDSKEIGIDRGDIVPALMKNVTIKGKIYSMPFNKSIPVLYYNKNLFKAAGLDPEKPPVTWDEFISYGKKLTMVATKNPDGTMSYQSREDYEKANGPGSFAAKKPSNKVTIWGNAFMPDPWSFENYIVQNGGKIISDDGKKALINTPEAIEAANYIIGKVKTHGFAIRTTGREHQNEFISGRVAMIEGTIVSKVFMEKDIKFPFGMTTVPYKKINMSVLSGTNVAIYSVFSDAEKIAAWKFIRWFTDTDQTARWAVRTTYMPVRKSAYQTEIVKQTLAKDPNMKPALTMLENIEFEPQVPSWFECRNILSKATEAVASIASGNLKAEPEKILNEAAEEMNGVLAQEE